MASERSPEPAVLLMGASGDLPTSWTEVSETRDTEQLCHRVPSWPGGREAISSQPSQPHTTERCPVLPQDKQGWAPRPRKKGQWSPGLCGEQIPSALQLCKELLPAGQASPGRLPVCVSAQTSIHFPKEDLLWKCN